MRGPSAYDCGLKALAGLAQGFVVAEVEAVAEEALFRAACRGRMRFPLGTA